MAIVELNYAEAAAHLNMKEARLRSLTKAGKGPKCRREGPSVRFLPDHLDEWVADYQKSAYTQEQGVPSSNRKAKSKRKSRAIAPTDSDNLL